MSAGFRPGLPWERRGEIGLPTGLLQTIWQVIASPSVAFSSMRQLGGWADPLGFAVLVGTVSLWIGQLWRMLMRSLLAAGTGMGVEEAAAQNLTEVWFALAAPLIVVVFTALGAGIAHLLLLLFGGAPHPYETTLRVISYTWAVNLFNILPFCGVFVAAVWGAGVQIIGLRDAQEVPVGRAAAAVLVPWLVACICAFMAVLIFGIGLAMFMQMAEGLS